MKDAILSIDQGTTSCRAIVFNAEGKPLGVGQQEFQQYFPRAGWVEHDAKEILDVQIKCIKQAIVSAGIKPEDVACVGITNQRETTVVWNRKTGEPIHPAIVWQCRRTQEAAQMMKIDAEWFRQKTGLVPDAYFSGPKIAWILDNVSGARQLAAQGDLAFGTIDTWLIWNLTKERSHLTEPSNASRTMLFSIHTLDWDPELLERVNIPSSMMPKVVASNANFGTTRSDLLGFEAPILSNLGDQQAALFGQGCFQPGMAKCTYGTGSFLLANIGTNVIFTPGMLTTVAWKLENEKPVYALEGAIFVAGAAIQWLRDGLKIIESSDETEVLTLSISSNEGVYFVPALVGLGSPWWNSDVRGTIVGLTRGSGRAHLVRAAMEAMAYQVADVVQDLKDHGKAISQLRVDGGATRNKFLGQFQADLLGVPVLKSAQTESTAWGVAALAGIKAGVIPSIERVSDCWSHDYTVEPKTDRKQEYLGWHRALKAAFAAAKNDEAAVHVAADGQHIVG
jgi:glycerol kinase